MTICGKCHTARDIEGRQCVPTVLDEAPSSGYTSWFWAILEAQMSESLLGWDQVSLKDALLMA